MSTLVKEANESTGGGDRAMSDPFEDPPIRWFALKSSISSKGRSKNFIQVQRMVLLLGWIECGVYLSQNACFCAPLCCCFFFFCSSCIRISDGLLYDRGASITFRHHHSCRSTSGHTQTWISSSFQRQRQRSFRTCFPSQPGVHRVCMVEMRSGELSQPACRSDNF